MENFGNCRSVTEFEKLSCIGEGSYGVVYRGYDTKNGGRVVALKKICMNEDEISASCLREISILYECQHQNIIRLHEVVVGEQLGCIFLVMDYCQYDLVSLMDDMSKPFLDSEVKSIMKQTLDGLRYIHGRHIIHRDIKPSNLLMTINGIIKIADFGQARKFNLPCQLMTPTFVTLWYRAPEILLGTNDTPGISTTAIDMWSTGCVFGELLLHKPLIPGRTELHQINLIIDLVGTPNEENWPGFSKLLACEEFTLKHQPCNNLKKKFPNLCVSGLNLLKILLLHDPSRRATANQCLEHAYFSEAPHPFAPSTIP